MSERGHNPALENGVSPDSDKRSRIRGDDQRTARAQHPEGEDPRHSDKR